MTFLIEYEIFIEILISWKGEESYLKGDGNIFSIMFHISVSIAHAGNPLVKAKRISPFSKPLWRFLVFSTNPTTVGYVQKHLLTLFLGFLDEHILFFFYYCCSVTVVPISPLYAPPPTSHISMNIFFAKDLKPCVARVILICAIRCNVN